MSIEAVTSGGSGSGGGSMGSIGSIGIAESAPAVGANVSSGSDMQGGSFSPGHDVLSMPSMGAPSTVISERSVSPIAFREQELWQITRPNTPVVSETPAVSTDIPGFVIQTSYTPLVDETKGEIAEITSLQHTTLPTLSVDEEPAVDLPSAFDKPALENPFVDFKTSHKPLSVTEEERVDASIFQSGEMQRIVSSDFLSVVPEIDPLPEDDFLEPIMESVAKDMHAVDSRKERNLEQMREESKTADDSQLDNVREALIDLVISDAVAMKGKVSPESEDVPTLEGKDVVVGSEGILGEESAKIVSVPDVVFHEETAQEVVTMLQTAGVAKTKAEDVVKKVIEEKGVTQYLKKPQEVLAAIKTKVAHVLSEKPTTHLVTKTGDEAVIVNAPTLPTPVQEKILTEVLGEPVEQAEIAPELVEIGLATDPTGEVSKQLFGIDTTRVVAENGYLGGMSAVIVEDVPTQNARRKTFGDAVKKSREQVKDDATSFGRRMLAQITLSAAHLSEIVRKRGKDGSLMEVVKEIAMIRGAVDARHTENILVRHRPVTVVKTPTDRPRATERELEKVVDTTSISSLQKAV